MLLDVVIVGPVDVFVVENIDIPTDGTSKEIDIGLSVGKPLKTILSFYAPDQNLNCTILPEGEKNESMINFAFIKDFPEKGRTAKRRGQLFGTGKFVPWTCVIERK